MRSEIASLLKTSRTDLGEQMGPPLEAQPALAQPTARDVKELAKSRGIDLAEARALLQQPSIEGKLWLPVESQQGVILRRVLGLEAAWALMNERTLYAPAGARSFDVSASMNNMLDGVNYAFFGLKGLMEARRFQETNTQSVQLRETRFSTSPIIDFDDVKSLGEAGITDTPFLPGAAGVYRVIDSFQADFAREESRVWGLLGRQFENRSDREKLDGAKAK